MILRYWCHSLDCPFVRSQMNTPSSNVTTGITLENTEVAINDCQSREKLATLGTQDTRQDKQNKNTAQYVLDTTIHKQTQIT